MASTGASNIINAPVNVLWQMEASEQWDFDDAVAATIGGQYVTMYLPTGVGYYAWFDENTTDADPAPAGLTAILVAYAAGASATVIATAFQVAVDAVSGFTATISGDVVTVNRDAVGRPTAPTVGTTTLIDLTICKTGQNLDLGLLQGDISVDAEPQNTEVTAHQTGALVRSLLHQGTNVSVTTTLQETTKSKLQTLYGLYGSTGVTPSAGTEVFGIGSAAIGSNLLRQAARLEMVPVTTIDAELSYNVNLMLALPVPGSLIFSGENPRTLEISWSGFPSDDISTTSVDVLLFGDPTQTGL